MPGGSCIQAGTPQPSMILISTHTEQLYFPEHFAQITSSSFGDKAVLCSSIHCINFLLEYSVKLTLVSYHIDLQLFFLMMVAQRYFSVRICRAASSQTPAAYTKAAISLQASFGYCQYPLFVMDNALFWFIHHDGEYPSSNRTMLMFIIQSSCLFRSDHHLSVFSI